MSREQDFERALDEALAMRAAGASLSDCLARFPQFAARLRPLLEAADLAREGLLAGQPLPPPDLARGRARFLQAALAAAPQPARSFWPAFYRLAAVGLALVLLLAFAGAGAALASSNALPGDALYPVKRGLEAVRLRLASDPAERARLAGEQAARRRVEAARLIELRREARVEFEGVVEAVGADRLVVSGLPLRPAATDRVRVGDRVRVVGDTTAAGEVVGVVTLAGTPAPVDSPGDVRPQSTPTTQSDRPAADQPTRSVDTQPTAAPVTDTRPSPTPISDARPSPTPQPDRSP